MTQTKFAKVIRLNTDSEFVAEKESLGFQNGKSRYLFTTPLTVQFREDSQLLGEGMIYSHPHSHPDSRKFYPIFNYNHAFMDYMQDYLGYEILEPMTHDRNWRIPNLLVECYFFYSEKDIAFSTSDKPIKGLGANVSTQFHSLHQLFLGAFTRTRCLKTQVKQGIRVDHVIKTNFKVSKDGQEYRLYFKYIDVCGLSNTSLKKTYQTYCGDMEFKDNLKNEEKSNLVEAGVLGTDRFNEYALGDLVMTDIVDNSVKLENTVRFSLGLPQINPDQKCMTVGAMVARILRDFIRLKLEIDDLQLNRFNVFTSPKNIQNFLRQFQRMEEVANLVYLGMGDGGRCVRELALHPVLKGFLADIDIDGCYGNGLKNQKYALGNPLFDVKKMTLGQFLKKYEKRLMPGLWQARVFCRDLGKFSQDLIVSKTREAANTYDRKLQHISIKTGEIDELDEALTSFMFTSTKEIYGGLINSDILEVIKNHTSNEEFKYWKENVYIHGFAGYLSDNRVDSMEDMEEGYAVTFEDIKRKKGGGEYSTKWIEIPLDELADKLLELRKNYDKKTPMNEFLKLVINAIYGVICSQWFDTKETGISNIIIANNITARARTLAWCMSKGLRTAMSITDGGVFDINNVIFLTKRLKKSTITTLTNITYDVYSNEKTRHLLYDLKPLLGRQINMEDYAIHDRAEDLEKLVKEIDSQAWQHCSNLFPNLTIFKQNQFKFESKNVYSDLILHNKSDYLLYNRFFEYKLRTREKPPQIILCKEDDPYLNHKQRGTKGKVALEASYALYDGVANEQPCSVQFEQESLIGLSEYQQAFARTPGIDEDFLLSDEEDSETDPQIYAELGNLFLQHGITPGDVKVQVRKLYSHIPTCMKHTTMAEFERSQKISERMRKEDNPRLGFDRMRECGWK
jgi:hypothetical protein